MNVLASVFLIFLLACSSRDFTGLNSKSSSQSANSSATEHSAIKNNELENAQAKNITDAETEVPGDRVYKENSETESDFGGITIGNGQNDKDEIEDASEPILVIGSYLTCNIITSSEVVCTADNGMQNVDYQNIKLLDENLNEIPLEELDFVVAGNELKITLNNPAKKITSIDPCGSLGGGSWVHVPGNSKYGTSDFCVMKFEAKCSQADGQDCTLDESPISKPESTAWRNISQNQAMQACQSLGTGYQLVSNQQWMTMATNIAGQGQNWTGGAVGSGSLLSGHSDSSPPNPCPAHTDDSLNVVEGDCTNLSSANDDLVEQRTHTVSGPFGQNVIWDLSGNAWEWTSFSTSGAKPALVGGDPNGWNEFTLLNAGSSTSPYLLPSQLGQDAPTWWNDSWGSSQAIGQYYPGPDFVGGSLMRGGYWLDDGVNVTGLFTASMETNPDFSFWTLGFRCTYTNP